MEDTELTEDDKARYKKLYPPNNVVCTESFSRFLKEYNSNFAFFFFVVRLVSITDEHRVVAARVLSESTSAGVDTERYKKSASDTDATLRELKKHSETVSRNLANGIVNAFQRYFSSIIQEAARKQPSMLSSSQTIRVEEVLRFTRHRDLVSFIIDRKINDLSYGGLAEMEKYFDDRLGIKMFQDNYQRDMLRFFVEARNINVHNGGIVNELFTNRVDSACGIKFSLGKALYLDFDDLAKLSGNAMDVALHIDRSVATKFSLRRRGHLSWPNRIGEKDRRNNS